MLKKQILTAATIGISVLFFVAGIYAAAPDVIKMQQDYEHNEGIVEFDHKKHAETYAKEYADLYKKGCGECHHDENNKPLTGLGPDDPVQSCIECHKKPGEVPKDLKKTWREKKIKKAEKKKMELEYHAEAIHDNCKGCHRAFNKKYKPKKAPTTCKTCHPKDEK